MPYISDSRYLLTDEDSGNIRKKMPEKSNVELKAAAVMSRGDYRKQQELQVVMLRNIGVNEELFQDYGMKELVIQVKQQKSLRKKNS